MVRCDAMCLRCAAVRCDVLWCGVLSLVHSPQKAIDETPCRINDGNNNNYNAAEYRRSGCFSSISNYGVVRNGTSIWYGACQRGSLLVLVMVWYCNRDGVA